MFEVRVSINRKKDIKQRWGRHAAAKKTKGKKASSDILKKFSISAFCPILAIGHTELRVCLFKSEKGGVIPCFLFGDGDILPKNAHWRVWMKLSEGDLDSVFLQQPVYTVST